MIDDKELMTVYDRKGNAIQMQWVRGNTYAKLDEQGKPTGWRVNLKRAIEEHAYFTTPKEQGGEQSVVQH